ncbi:MAG: DUF3288 family protein [Cyanobacteria bacterium P01_H01_bin.119]
MGEASKEQQHPQYRSDRQVVAQLLQAQPDDYNLAELARLRIRYKGFPGAYDIQNDLDKVLTLWKLDEDALFAKTHEIHQRGDVYRGRGAKASGEDWS